jgi:predicted nucleotidyltransferase
VHPALGSPGTYGAERTASQVSQALANSQDILAVCLIGSVARGDDVPGSDIDLLVIGDEKLRRLELLSRLPPELRRPELSLLSYGRSRWIAEAEAGSLFVHHARLEGRILSDREGVLEEGFRLAASRPPDVDAELRRQVKRLRLYRDPVRLNGEHLFALSHLYAIGKAVAIARCLELDETTFVKEEALNRLAYRRPDLADEVAAVAELRPFYDLTRERNTASLPFEPVDVSDKLEHATRAIERMAYG